MTATEKWYIQQIKTGDAISVLQYSFPGNFPVQKKKKIPIAEAEMKSIIQFLKPNKNHQVMMT